VKHYYWGIVQAKPAAEMTQLAQQFEDLGLYGVWVPQLHFPGAYQKLENQKQV
jgi:alkanesulfonate monooxygenase SsuD/methylene tetrahydromethanopterin reductase-like flavin-dependent oxidoreductase (luciferase family)